MMRLCVVCVLFMLLINITNAAPLGLEFVHIGNAGNPGEQSRLADYNDTTYYGAVDYEYYIGKYEITNAQWDAFTDAADAPTGNPSDAYDENATYTGALQPTNYVSWYEAAQFCNWLTSGDKSAGAYQLSTDGSITIDRDAALLAYGVIYVIPTENEWYKAAYYRPDGSGYSTYANGTDVPPIAGVDTNYAGAIGEPWDSDADTGTMEQNSTFNMMGNVWEWNETQYGSSRCLRGAGFNDGGTGDGLKSCGHIDNYDPSLESLNIGFRVALVPEPITLSLLAIGSLALIKKRLA